MKKLLGVLFIAGLVSMTSCQKYDEGGLVKKAEKTLVKEWAMERAYKNETKVEVINSSVNSQIGEVTENWIFKEDGTCTTEDGNGTLSGTWSLSGDSKSLTVVISSPSNKASTETYEILKMTKGSDGEMIWEQTKGTDLYRYELRSSL